MKYHCTPQEANELPSLPPKQQDCASQQFSGGSYAGCGTDPKCICENQDFLGNIACCLTGACDQADQTSAIAFATQICSAQGVAVPTVVSCSTGSAASATGTASSSSGTGTSTGTATTTGTATAGTATAVTTSGSTAGAWAPGPTGAMGLEMLGLAAAGIALL